MNFGNWEPRSEGNGRLVTFGKDHTIFADRRRVSPLAWNLKDGADALLAKRFPKVILLDTPEKITPAIQECDFLVAGSSSGLGGSSAAGPW